MKKVTFLTFLVFVVLFGFSGFAQEVWKEASIKGKTLKGNKTQLPVETHFFTFNGESLKSTLAAAPKRGNGIQSNTVISLPGVDGKMMDFVVYEASNFSPELQADFPEINAYRGISISQPWVSANLSFSQFGLKAMITGLEKSIFIEPVTIDETVYASYNKLKKNEGQYFECLTENENVIMEKAYNEYVAMNSLNADDQVLRTFRLAVSVTGEYTTYHGGTVAGAMAAINETMTRVNAIFERDFAINMEIIANNQDVIYTNASTDPYSGMNNWNAQLESTLNSVIGFSNYDVGHLFGGSGGGGNAGCIGCVCESGKGSGYTSPADGIPEGDNFDIDYVAHEMGHQFGATHTFSRSEGSGANLEPGSGTTIMGYAGITGPTDVQPHSDDLFLFYSIFQVTQNMESKACPEETPLSNNPPTVYAGSNFTIPVGTPFKLTAIGSDPDGDPITYSWEEADLSTSSVYSFPDPNATTGPLFRVMQTTTSPTRYFPSFDKVLNNNLFSVWETLPNVARNMNFTVQVRDNNANIGQTASDNTLISVNADNGPFKITGVGNNQTIFANTDFNLHWNVAGTDVPPSSSATVNILYSNDGGETFTTLAAGTANDGSEIITIPSGNTIEAYFMVESVENIFYAVSPRVLIGYEAETVCHTYDASAGLPVAIPAGLGTSNPGQYGVAGFNVPNIGTISDMNLTIGVEHDFVSDLQVILQSPASIGQDQLGIWNRECGNENDFNIVFDDSGSIINCGNLTSGTYKPSQPLSAFNGMEAAGQWLVGIRDWTTQNSGTFTNAILEICTTEYNTAGTKENDILEGNLSLYPNPTKDMVTVAISNKTEGASYSLYDMLGRMVYSAEDTASQTETVIDLSQLSSGVYLLKVETGGAKVTKKLIKQ